MKKTKYPYIGIKNWSNSLSPMGLKDKMPLPDTFALLFECSHEPRPGCRRFCVGLDSCSRRRPFNKDHYIAMWRSTLKLKIKMKTQISYYSSNSAFNIPWLQWAANHPFLSHTRSPGTLSKIPPESCLFLLWWLNCNLNTHLTKEDKYYLCPPKCPWSTPNEDNDNKDKQGDIQDKCNYERWFQRCPWIWEIEGRPESSAGFWVQELHQSCA